MTVQCTLYNIRTFLQIFLASSQINVNCELPHEIRLHSHSHTLLYVAGTPNSSLPVEVFVFFMINANLQSHPPASVRRYKEKIVRIIWVSSRTTEESAFDWYTVHTKWYTVLKHCTLNTKIGIYCTHKMEHFPQAMVP